MNEPTITRVELLRPALDLRVIATDAPHLEGVLTDRFTLSSEPLSTGATIEHTDDTGNVWTFLVTLVQIVGKIVIVILTKT